MSKILITGNGFDLFHHLPTKYGHFMAVLETIENDNFELKNELKFDDLFGKNFKDKYSADYENIKLSFDCEKIIFNTDEIKNIKSFFVIDKIKTENHIDKKSLYNHFKTLNKLNTWIDFEVEIKNLLNDFKVLFNYVEENNKGNNMYRYSVKDYFQKFEIFNLIINLNGQVFKINEEFLINNISKPNVEIIIQAIADSLENFTSLFNIYLSHIVNEFFNYNRNKNLINIELIDKIYTFNYTSTLENLYSYDESKITYLHGKSNKKKHNIILGVDEIDDDLKKYKLFEFTKYYQKIKKNTNLKFIDSPDLQRLDYEQTIFYFFGHSLDESDKEYIFDVFSFLKEERNKLSQICIFYYNENDKIMKIKNLLNIMDKGVIVDLNKREQLFFIELNKENVEMQFNKELIHNRIYM